MITILSYHAFLFVSKEITIFALSNLLVAFLQMWHWCCFEILISAVNRIRQMDSIEKACNCLMPFFGSNERERRASERTNGPMDKKGKIWTLDQSILN